jgi:hypothetical protein
MASFAEENEEVLNKNFITKSYIEKFQQKCVKHKDGQMPVSLRHDIKEKMIKKDFSRRIIWFIVYILAILLYFNIFFGVIIGGAWELLAFSHVWNTPVITWQLFFSTLLIFFSILLFLGHLYFKLVYILYIKENSNSYYKKYSYIFFVGFIIILLLQILGLIFYITLKFKMRPMCKPGGIAYLIDCDNATSNILVFLISWDIIYLVILICYTIAYIIYAVYYDYNTNDAIIAASLSKKSPEYKEKMAEKKTQSQLVKLSKKFYKKNIFEGIEANVEMNDNAEQAFLSNTYTKSSKKKNYLKPNV